MSLLSLVNPAHEAEKDTYLVLGITAQPPVKGSLLFHLQFGGMGHGPEAGLSSAPPTHHVIQELRKKILGIIPPRFLSISEISIKCGLV